jgi:hypothetical protein
MQSSSLSKKSKAKSQRFVLVKDPAIDIQPPPIPTQFRFGVHLRFVKASNAVATVAWVDLLNLYVMAISTTVGYSIIDAVRLRRITAYALPLVNNAAAGIAQDATLRIVFNGNVSGTTFGSDRTASAYPSAFGAKCSLKPQPPNDDWNNSGAATPCFSVYGQAGVICDVKLSVQLRGSITGASTALASTGATIGRVYGNYLDSSLTQLFQALGPVNNTLVWV